jgi:hypothetical protein
MDGGKTEQAQHDRRRHTCRSSATTEGSEPWELGLPYHVYTRQGIGAVKNHRRIRKGGVGQVCEMSDC